MCSSASVFCLFMVVTMLKVCTAVITVADMRKMMDAYKKECLDDPAMQIAELQGRIYCNVEFDRSLACLPKTTAGMPVTVPCFQPFYFGTVTKFCTENGTWPSSFVFNNCTRKPVDQILKAQAAKLTELALIEKKELDKQRARQRRDDIRRSLIFYLRYVDTAVTLVTLLLLLLVVPIWNPRVNMHRCLILSFFAFDALMCGVNNTFEFSDPKLCNALWAFVMYFFLAQVCWMFCEGLFRASSLYFAFMTKNYFWAYMLFGWGYPAVVVFAVYVPIMLHFGDGPRKVPNGMPSCWSAQQETNNLFYIVVGNAFFLLSINCIFILYILYILVTKIRRSNSTQANSIAKECVASYFCSCFSEVATWSACTVLTKSSGTVGFKRLSNALRAPWFVLSMCSSAGRCCDPSDRSSEKSQATDWHSQQSYQYRGFLQSERPTKSTRLHQVKSDQN